MDGKNYLQGTSSLGYKTDLKIVTNPGIASSCFEQPGRDVETYCPSKANSRGGDAYVCLSDKFTSLFLFSGDRACFSKAVIRMLGLDLGTVRSPLSKLDVSQELELKKDLERIGFFDWFR